MTERSRARIEALARRSELGLRGEQLACDHLVSQGFSILARNVRVGRLEIDVIAHRGRLLVFCEVRSRSSDRVMTTAQSIQPDKVRRVRAAAAAWLKENPVPSAQVRFDAISVVFDRPEGRLNHLVGAF
jgi:putative endonuclease